MVFETFCIQEIFNNNVSSFLWFSYNFFFGGGPNVASNEDWTYNQCDFISKPCLISQLDITIAT